MPKPRTGQNLDIISPCQAIVQGSNTKGNTMKAYKHFIKYALNAGHTVSVYDGEEWQVKRSTGYKAIVEAVESVEEAALRIRDNQGNIVVSSVTVSAFGLEDDETVVDYVVTPFMDAWEEAYNLSVA